MTSVGWWNLLLLDAETVIQGRLPERDGLESLRSSRYISTSPLQKFPSRFDSSTSLFLKQATVKVRHDSAEKKGDAVGEGLLLELFYTPLICSHLQSLLCWSLFTSTNHHFIDVSKSWAVVVTQASVAVRWVHKTHQFHMNPRNDTPPHSHHDSRFCLQKEPWALEPRAQRDWEGGVWVRQKGGKGGDWVWAGTEAASGRIACSRLTRVMLSSAPLLRHIPICGWSSRRLASQETAED